MQKEKKAHVWLKWDPILYKSMKLGSEIIEKKKKSLRAN